MRESIKPEERVAVTLRYLATGETCTRNPVSDSPNNDIWNCARRLRKCVWSSGERGSEGTEFDSWMAFLVGKIREPLSAGNQRLLPETSKQTIFLPLHVFGRCSSPTGQDISFKRSTSDRVWLAQNSVTISNSSELLLASAIFKNEKLGPAAKGGKKKIDAATHLFPPKVFDRDFSEPNRLWRAIQLIIIETRMSWYLTPCSSYWCSKWTGNSYHKGAVSPKSRRTNCPNKRSTTSNLISPAQEVLHTTQCSCIANVFRWISKNSLGNLPTNVVIEPFEE